jgi:uncharacterized membrane protein
MNVSLSLSNLSWLWPALAAFVLLLVLAAWSYRRARGGWRWTGLALKTLGLALLALCLLEPVWVGQRAKPGANAFAVLADNSESLRIRPEGAAASRGETLRPFLEPRTASWQRTLADTFEVRRYAFDARLQPTEDFHELDFSGRSTALGSALRATAERFRGRALAGVVLFTDGVATDLPRGLGELPAGIPPVYPVIPAEDRPVRDVALAEVRASQTAFEDAPVTIEADVTATGFAGRSVQVRLVDASGRLAQEQGTDLRGDEARATLRFQLKPEGGGLVFYRVEVALRPDASGNAPAEATLANNARVVVVDRGQGPFRVLYVAGRPNWEFKFLNRAVEEDAQVQLVGLIRVAKREPKFDFRGRSGESSNPLFRGFGAQSPEEVQRYDQPVLVRLNTRDEVELRSGFPRTPEDLFGYHAVIVDDLEAEFFAADQAQLLQRFVSERGGGFLMLGGMESFQEGNYRRTPVGDMLPVYLDRDEAASEPPGALRLQLAREGWLQPWARLRDNEAEERARLESMPPLGVLNRVRGLKPGASVIATVRDEKGAEMPALAVQRFGRGRTAALMVGDLWRWGMHDAAAHADMDKAWRQLVRWLVADVPARVQVLAEPVAGDANGTMRLQVRVKDAAFQPVDDATVELEIAPVAFGSAPPAGRPLRLTAEATAREPGLYEIDYVPRFSGGFRATATVRDGKGADLGRAETGWSTDLVADEFRSLVPNRALLEELARRTGGRVVAPEELDALARRLPQERAPQMEAWSTPAWHNGIVFALALAVLLAEWGLRRWKGLA